MTGQISYRREIRSILREWFANRNVNEVFHIYYKNGDYKFIGDYFYDGEKVHLQGIKNIEYIGPYDHCDFNGEI